MKSIENDIITLAKILVQKKLKLVTAESCTGGGLAYALTNLSGSSQWFERGFITYSNESKNTLLNVPESLINNHGAVSAEVAHKMAEGALKNSLADISLSITGIAGPDGGTPEKPVGTVWFGFAAKSQVTRTFHQQFSGNRAEIRRFSIEYAIHTILDYLKNLTPL